MSPMCRFEYNLVLQDLQAPPITLTRCERLTFYSPQEELKKKLLAAGGVSLTPYARAAPLLAPYSPQEGLKKKLLAAGGVSLTPYARAAPLLAPYSPQEELKKKLLAAGGVSLTPYARAAPLLAPGAASQADVATSEKRLPLLNPAPLAAPHNKTSERKTAKRVTYKFPVWPAEPQLASLASASEDADLATQDQNVTHAFTEIFGEPLKLHRPSVDSKSSVTRAANIPHAASNTSFGTCKSYSKSLVTRAANIPHAASNTSFGTRESYPKVKGGCSFKTRDEDELKKNKHTDKKERKLKDIFIELFGEDSDEEKEKSKRPRKDAYVLPAAAHTSLGAWKSCSTVTTNSSSKSLDIEVLKENEHTKKKKRNLKNIFKELFGEDSDEEEMFKRPSRKDTNIAISHSTSLGPCMSHSAVKTDRSSNFFSFHQDQKLSNAVIELSGELLKLTQTQASALEAKTSVTRAVNSARDAANAFLVAWHSDPSVMLECYSKPPFEGRTESRDKKKRKLSELFGEDRDEEAVRLKHPRKDDSKSADKGKCGKSNTRNKSHRILASSLRRPASPTKQEILRAVFGMSSGCCSELDTGASTCTEESPGYI
ncbi:uncharacterized protein LOC125177769 [Hyalella azteca]|uniref:Uncharacterized protein LOC125177769 n=1 Tax=Hyalella azteca TaxID=294128 RepID=A0A979FIK8_HYAAZ|nr:uncharacterized protein LOC125177769 [Hyalella azteca]